MVDMFSRYFILAPIKEKTARAVAHAVVTKLICEHTAPRVLLNDNGAELRNKVLAENFTQFGITRTCAVAYHHASNGLVERTNRKILEILRAIVGRFIGTWEDWLSQVAATIIFFFYLQQQERLKGTTNIHEKKKPASRPSIDSKSKSSKNHNQFRNERCLGTPLLKIFRS